MGKIRDKQPDADAGRVMVDEQLEDLEARLTAIYTDVAKEMQKDMDSFMVRYKAEDEKKKEQVENGELSQEAYESWKERQIFRSDAMQAKIDDLTSRAVNADKQAMAMVNDQLPETYATSYNFGGYKGEVLANAAGYDYTQFTIINQDAVKTLMKENPDLIPWKPDVDVPEDEKWNRQKVQEAVLQGIVKGDSMDDVAKRLLPIVNMDKNAAIRTARTAVNGIENKGRKDATERVKEAGIPMVERWSCTHDDRTRDTHILLDGTEPNNEGKFGEGILSTLIEYPGDPAGDPEEVYNCRCGLLSTIAGIDHTKDKDLYAQMMEKDYFEDWVKVKEDIDTKEKAFQAKKEGAAERVEAKKERQAEKEAEKDEKKQAEEPEYKTATNKEEAIELLHDIGFDEISNGLSKLDEQTIIDTANRLSELNSKFGAITPGMNLEVKSLKKGVLAEVNTMRGEIGSTDLSLSSTRYVDGYNLQKKSAEEWLNSPINGWQMPSDEEYWNVYVITHEYGHMLQNSITRTEDVISKYLAINPDSGDPNWFENKKQFWNENITEVRIRQMNEIIEIAQENNPDFKLMDNISRYGQTNELEFFAECFANSQCGKPNELGVAMNEWLRRQGYAT